MDVLIGLENGLKFYLPPVRCPRTWSFESSHETKRKTPASQSQLQRRSARPSGPARPPSPVITLCPYQPSYTQVGGVVRVEVGNAFLHTQGSTAISLWQQLSNHSQPQQAGHPWGPNQASRISYIDVRVPSRRHHLINILQSDLTLNRHMHVGLAKTYSTTSLMT